MVIPTRADLRAALAEALRRHDVMYFYSGDATVIRAAVEVVLGDPVDDALRPTTARHRAVFLALAEAIEEKA